MKRPAVMALLILCMMLCGTARAAEKSIIGEANGQRFHVMLPALVEIQRCVQEFMDPFGNKGGPELHEVIVKVLFTVPPVDDAGKSMAPLQPTMFHYQVPAGTGAYNFVQPYKERTKQAIVLFKGSAAFYGPDTYPVLLVFTRVPNEGSETDFITLRVNGEAGKYGVVCAVPEKKVPPKEPERPRDAS